MLEIENFVFEIKNKNKNRYFSWVFCIFIGTPIEVTILNFYNRRQQ